MVMFREHVSQGSRFRELADHSIEQLYPRSFQETRGNSIGIPGPGASQPGKPSRLVDPASFADRTFGLLAQGQTATAPREVMDPRARSGNGMIWAAQSTLLRLSIRFLATTPTSTADQRMTESGSGLLTIPLVVPLDDELLPLLDPDDVEFVAGSRVIVTPGVSDVSTGGSLARALLTLRAKSRTPPA